MTTDFRGQLMTSQFYLYVVSQYPQSNNLRGIQQSLGQLYQSISSARSDRRVKTLNLLTKLANSRDYSDADVNPYLEELARFKALDLVTSRTVYGLSSRAFEAHAPTLVILRSIVTHYLLFDVGLRVDSLKPGRMAALPLYDRKPGL
jgi:hypothetical protein